VRLADGTRDDPRPDPGRAQRREAEETRCEHGIERWTTDLDEALGNPDDRRFFRRRVDKAPSVLLKKALAAKKHVYCEKPVATSLAQALDLYRAAKKAGVRHGVVQDKLWAAGAPEDQGAA